MRNAPLVALLVVSAFARADDGFLNFSGAPRLMARHPSVRMVRERVVVEIRRKGYHVDATFVFRNEGKACAVRMGFPDVGDDESDAGAGKKGPAIESLKGFRSWVDGRAVATSLVRNAKDATHWRTKRVAFAAWATRRVRVAYDADGGGATNGVNGQHIRQARYVMHTGASWKGLIGLAEVVVRFGKGTLVGDPMPVDAAILREGDPYALADWGKLDRAVVFWRGFASPEVVGRELRFVRRRFEPGEDDDVDVYFGYGYRL